MQEKEQKSSGPAWCRAANNFYLEIANLLHNLLDLQSSLFTFGNKSKLSFHLLNHKLLTVLDGDALEALLNLLTSEVVHRSVNILSSLYSLNA